MMKKRMGTTLLRLVACVLAVCLLPAFALAEEPAEKNLEEEAGEASAEEAIPEEAGDITVDTEEKQPEDAENDLP